jgi:hypothetical protein
VVYPFGRKGRDVRANRGATSRLWQRFVIFSIYFEMHHLCIDAPQLSARMPFPTQANPTKRLRAVSSFTAMTKKAPVVPRTASSTFRHIEAAGKKAGLRCATSTTSLKYV